MIRKLGAVVFICLLLLGCSSDNVTKSEVGKLDAAMYQGSAVTRKLVDTAVVRVGNSVSIQYSIEPSSINPNDLGTNAQRYVKASGIRPLAVYESIVSKLKAGDPVVSIESSKNEAVKNLVNAFVKPDIVQTLKFSSSVENDMMNGYPKAVSVGDLNSTNGIINSDMNAYGNYKNALEGYINAVPGVILTLPIYNQTNTSFTRFARFRVNEASITFVEFVQDYSFSLTNTIFTETFPKGLAVQLPNDSSFKKDVTTNGETIVTGNIGDFVYKKNSSGLYETNGYTFSIKVTPQEKGQYSLNRSSVSFQDIDGKSQGLQFENLLVTAKNGLQSVSIPPSLEIKLDGGQQNVRLSYNPADAAEQGIVQSVKWSAEPGQAVISVDPNTGMITPLAPGTAKVSVTVQDIFGMLCQATTIVTVVRPYVSKLEVTPNTLVMKEGETVSANTYFQITIEPKELSDVPLKWALKTPNPLSPVTVSESGLFTANRPTTVPVVVTVTAQDGSGKTAEVSVTVIANHVPLTGISFSSPSKTISVGDTFNVSSLLVFLPATATNQQVSWSSNDSRFVTINDSGVIQGKAKGYATITAVSKDGGKTTSIVIYVTEKGGASLPNGGDTPLFRW